MGGAKQFEASYRPPLILGAVWLECSFPLSCICIIKDGDFWLSIYWSPPDWVVGKRNCTWLEKVFVGGVTGLLLISPAF